MKSITKQKQIKSLVLATETLKALSTDRLAAVAAGADYYSKLSVCEMNTCNRNP